MRAMTQSYGLSLYISSLPLFLSCARERDRLAMESSKNRANFLFITKKKNFNFFLLKKKRNLESPKGIRTIKWTFGSFGTPCIYRKGIESIVLMSIYTPCVQCMYTFILIPSLPISLLSKLPGLSLLLHFPTHSHSARLAPFLRHNDFLAPFR